MSASPAGPPSGPPSTTPNGGPAPMRRRKPGGPMVIKKKRPMPRPPGQPPPSRPLADRARPGSSTVPTAPVATEAPDPDDDPSLYAEYPLITTKRALLEGLRHHVIRFASDKPVNPYDPSEGQFQRPIRLQRRYPNDTPRAPVPNAGENPDDDKEREREAIRKAERQAEREANQAQIAPTDKTAAAKKRQPFKKKTEDVYFPTDTPEAQKRAKLRYEEGRPWHLEDFTGTNSWIGKYEEPLSETHAMFALQNDGNFRMVPLEKWYRFAPTGRYSTLNLDEAEMHLSKKAKVPRFMGATNEKALERQRADEIRLRRLENGRVGARGELKREDDDQRDDIAHDADELDFEAGEEFQDDDEDKLFGGDEEDIKDAERKIKEERHGANIFAGTGVKEDKDWFEEEEKDKREAAEERKKAKRLRKNLIKREKKFEYESESDHPYSEESDSEDSEEERTREEEERKKSEEESKANGEKLPSGASSMGTNTPSGRAEKQADALRNKSSIANLKRPGSPNLSDASGSESTHKRIKKEHGSRPMSPSGPGSLSPNPSSSRRNPGSGSDTETSGTERRSKKTAHGRSMPGSPANATTPAGSRSGTPAPAQASLPTADDVRAAIPAEGIAIPDLIAKFKPQISKVPGGNKAFVDIVKSVVKVIPNTGGLVGVK